jgi:hypothetical protein
MSKNEFYSSKYLEIKRATGGKEDEDCMKNLFRKSYRNMLGMKIVINRRPV